jgi:hypothetical protein
LRRAGFQQARIARVDLDINRAQWAPQFREAYRAAADSRLGRNRQ